MCVCQRATTVSDPTEYLKFIEFSSSINSVIEATFSLNHVQCVNYAPLVVLGCFITWVGNAR